MYYALAKVTKEDNCLKEKYLKGSAITVNEIVGFTKEEEKELIKQILTLKSQGFSVRKAVYQLSNNNVKLALRYQNKYRNALKNKALIEEALKEINFNSKNVLPFIKPKKTTYESSIEKLKEEIDGLVERISFKQKQENERLKEKIATLETENLKLSNLLFLAENKSTANRHICTKV